MQFITARREAGGRVRFSVGERGRSATVEPCTNAETQPPDRRLPADAPCWRIILLDGGEVVSIHSEPQEHVPRWWCDLDALNWIRTGQGRSEPLW